MGEFAGRYDDHGSNASIHFGFGTQRRDGKLWKYWDEVCQCFSCTCRRDGHKIPILWKVSQSLTTKARSITSSKIGMQYDCTLVGSVYPLDTRFDSKCDETKYVLSAAKDSRWAGMLFPLAATRCTVAGFFSSTWVVFISSFSSWWNFLLFPSRGVESGDFRLPWLPWAYLKKSNSRGISPEVEFKGTNVLDFISVFFYRFIIRSAR